MKLTNIVKTLVAATVLTASAAHAEFRMIVPQGPGQGTSVWASIIAKHLEKQLGEKVVIQHIPGAKDIPGFNEFHNKLRMDNKTIMVSHGGNGVSFLVDKVDYDYSQYESIGMQNLNIVLGRKDAMDPKNPASVARLAGGSGLEPDGMAVAMLMCGNLPKKEDYLACFKKRVVWVNGMPGSERRLAFMRNELNTTRETTVAWFKFYTSVAENKLWFHHGIYDLKTGRVGDDPNFPAGYKFEDVFKSIHGQAPKGEFFEAYQLSRTFRDVLQKALWVNKGNPNTQRLRAAVQRMVTDPDAARDLEADTGKYEWITGDEGNRIVDRLRRNVTEKKLQDLVWWHDNAYGFKSEFKPQLVIK
jgi:hypothetical protein